MGINESERHAYNKINIMAVSDRIFFLKELLMVSSGVPYLCFFTEDVLLPDRKILRGNSRQKDKHY